MGTTRDRPPLWVLREIAHHRGYYAGSPTTVGTTRDSLPPWVLRGIAHHRGYYAVSPTTVGTTRDHPPPWALRGIAHHRAYYAASPTTVDTRPHREPRSAKVPHFHAPTRPASRNSLETAPLAHTRPERSVVHARSIRETSKKQQKNGKPSHPSFMGSGVCL